MIAATPIDPATSNGSPAGFGASVAVRAVASSANVPSPVPNTSSPGFRSSTPSATDSTTPARSQPRTGSDGPFSPPIIGRAIRGQPRIRRQSPALTDAARTRTTAWSGSSSGGAISASLKVFGGAVAPVQDCLHSILLLRL